MYYKNNTFFALFVIRGPMKMQEFSGIGNTVGGGRAPLSAHRRSPPPPPIVRKYRYVLCQNRDESCLEVAYFYSKC